MENNECRNTELNDNGADAEAVISHLPPTAARALAVEILLSDPEWLADDVLESCLYLLRERLQEESAPAELPGQGYGGRVLGGQGGTAGY